MICSSLGTDPPIHFFLLSVADVRDASGKLATSVWCFLENVRDPIDPTSGCFPDATWSARDGRFWSAQACSGIPVLEEQAS